MNWTPENIEEAFERMCKYIAEGNSLNSALRQDNVPAKNTFFKWIDHTRHVEPSEELIKECNDRLNQYTRARNDMADTLFDELIDLAEDRKDVQYVDENGSVRVDSGAVAAKRLEFQAKQWSLSKMQPKKYGDKMDLTSGGEKISSAPSKIEIEIVRKKD